jgi:uncharacterized protein
VGQRLALIALLFATPVAADCSQQSVELKNPDGTTARFTIEVADTASERALGLMGRQKLATSKGMLFVYEAPQTVSFWMENTLIPLDMIFADETGVVRRVAEMAKPLDRTPIPGGDGIRFVLEINGGLAADLGIGEGTILRHPSVETSIAAWSCSP